MNKNIPGDHYCPAARKSIMVFLLAAAALSQVSCGTIDVKSRWRDFPITVDGRSEDWGDALVRFKDVDVALGVANDENAVFVCLEAGNGGQPVPFMARGLVLWVDAKGGKRTEYGIRFPLGIDPQAAREIAVNPEDRARAQARRREAMAQSRDEIEIIGLGDVEPRRLKIADIKGLEIAARTTAGRFVYEVRIPLAADETATFSIGSAPGKKIGLGLEIPESGSANFRPGMGGRGRGGMGGMGGGMRGGMGGRMGGRMSGRGAGLQNFKIWARVQLASEPGTSISAGPSSYSKRRPS
jgi:hypothetical protein